MSANQIPLGVSPSIYNGLSFPHRGESFDKEGKFREARFQRQDAPEVSVGLAPNLNPSGRSVGGGPEMLPPNLLSASRGAPQNLHQMSAQNLPPRPQNSPEVSNQQTESHRPAAPQSDVGYPSHEVPQVGSPIKNTDLKAPRRPDEGTVPLTKVEETNETRSEIRGESPARQTPQLSRDPSPVPGSPGSRAQSPAAGSRAQSPAAGSRAQSPAAGSRAQSPAAGSRAQSPAAGSRNLSPTAGSRAQSPAAGSRANSPRSEGALEKIADEAPADEAPADEAPADEAPAE